MCGYSLASRLRILAQEFPASLMQLSIDLWFAFGIGIESLPVTVAFHSLAEAKGPADIFDNREVTIKSLMSETHIAPFDSDSDADPDRIPRRQRYSENVLISQLADTVDLHICAGVFHKLNAAWYRAVVCLRNPRRYRKRVLILALSLANQAATWGRETENGNGKPAFLQT